MIDKQSRQFTKSLLKECNGVNAMKNLTLFGLIFIFLAANCAATDPIPTGENSGKAILENISGNVLIPSNNSTQLLNSTGPNNSTQYLNSTPLTNPPSLKNSTSTNDTANQTSNTTKKAASDLWSWGSVPPGYTIDKSGKLVKLPTTEEWLPSI